MSEYLTTCRSLKDSLLTFLGQQVEVSAVEHRCILTLPLKTLDGRYLEVFVDQTVGDDYVLVHDGGNAVAELFLQGIHLTSTRESQMRQIAKRYRANFIANSFSVGVKHEKVNDAILAIAQCSSLAMFDVIKHEPVIEEEPILALVKRTLRLYRPEEVEMRYRVPVTGSAARADHSFDAVAFSRVTGRKSVAIKTLGTAYTPHVQNERYGFLALDIRGTDYDKWPRLAVVAKSDRWSRDELALVRRLSSKTLELKTGEDGEIDRLLPIYIDELAA